MVWPSKWGGFHPTREHVRYADGRKSREPGNQLRRAITGCGQFRVPRFCVQRSGKLSAFRGVSNENYRARNRPCSSEAENPERRRPVVAVPSSPGGVFTGVLGRTGESKSGWYLIQRQSILDDGRTRKIPSPAKFRRRFQPDSTHPRGMGSAKTPEDVSCDFSLMVTAVFSVQSKTRISRQPCAPFA
jgi:hypothetical protein